jgi:hypothetical protein
MFEDDPQDTNRESHQDQGGQPHAQKLKQKIDTDKDLEI